MIEFFVPGRPAPQGSKRHVGKGILIESSKEVGPWRERVAIAAHNAMKGEPLFTRDEPLHVDIWFHMPKPASAAKKKLPMVKRPDIDKLGRAILDALTDVVFEDDSQVVDLGLHKHYDEVGTPGAVIHVGTYSAGEKDA